MNDQSTNTEGSLRGKFALVTGSSRGIGRGIALKLAEKGATIAINYLKDEAAAKDTLARVKELGAEGMIVQADVSKPKELTDMLNRVNDDFGALDIFINNALGDLLGFMVPPLQVSLEQWDEAFHVQSRAFLVAVQHLSSYMRNNGRIVAISYWPGSHLGGFLPYFAMGTNKAALEAMCRYFAVALAPKGITVNALCPGITDDSIVNSLPKEATEAMLSWLKQGWNPMGRPGTPADIGAAVASLCNEDAGWITGQTIVADGGASLMCPEVPLDFQRP
ncbi:SDR family oxidoreductase [Aquiflexum sp.]|uniref:SDR family oxidoreductase n=1 Tax=Aquiflexum sp. TaxID=1872584 RepID=UPI0035932205